MYKNIGKTLKVTAIVLQIILLLATIFICVTSVLSGTNVFHLDLFGLTGSTASLVIAAIIFIVGFVTTMSLYAYGDLVENVKEMNEDEYYDEEEDEEEDEDEDLNV